MKKICMKDKWVLLALLLGSLALSGCGDLKFVLGDDSSDNSDNEETNTDSGNSTDNSTKGP